MAAVLNSEYFGYDPMVDGGYRYSTEDIKAAVRCVLTEDRDSIEGLKNELEFWNQVERLGSGDDTDNCLTIPAGGTLPTLQDLFC